jgi:hypothetical protein
MGARKREPKRKLSKDFALRHLPYVLGLLAVATALAHFRTQIDSNDEGIAAMGAWRVLRGEIPYRDFFAVETPLSFYLVAPLYALFGVSFTVGRVVAQFLGLGIVICVFQLVRRWIPSPLFAALPLAFLCQAGVGIFPFASHHWFADLFCLIAVVAADRALASQGKLGWWLAGAASAWALLSLQDQGALMLLGLAAVAAFVPEPGSRRLALGRLLGGAVVAGLPLALAVIPRAGLAAMWRDLVAFPLTGYRATQGNDLGFLQPFSELAGQWTSGAWRHAPLFTAGATVTSVALIGTPLAAPFLALWTWRRRKAPLAIVSLLLAATIAFLLTAAHRWAPINLQWAAAPPAIALAFWLHREREAAPRRRWPTAVAVVLILAFGVFGVGRILQAADRGLWFAVDSPAGRTRVPSRAIGQQIQEMIAVVGQRVPATDPLVVYGWPTWGFATLRVSPLRWDVFAPPAFPPGSLSHEAIAEVEAKKAPCIVTPPFEQPGPEERDEWKVYLISHYTLEWANAGWGLFRRIDRSSLP